MTETHPHMVTGVIEETHDGPYMVTGVVEETHDGPYMVTGATERHGMVTGVTEEVRNSRDLVTAVQEEIPYCSSRISSGKQKKVRSTSQRQFRSENTPATTEADQILLALQQLATNSNSANFNNNINPITQSRNCLNPLQRRCLRLTENQRNSNCLKICSRRV